MPKTTKTEPASQSIADLNTEQAAAVLHGEGPLLIVAGAGTGKTGVITRRIAHLIEEQGVPASEILAITFTEKAAGEMLDRLIGMGLSQLPEHIQTFHAFGDELLREYSFEVGLPPTYQLLADAEQVIFLEDHFDELPLELLKPRGRPVKHLEELTKAFNRAKSEDLSAGQYQALVKKRLAAAKKLPAGDERADLERRLAVQAEVAAAYAKYEELKARHYYIDHGDQISLPLRLLREHPEIQARLRKAFPWVLVDEYQDTNSAQSALIKYVAGEDGNLTVVGDDDQSIYGFQGAAIGNILRFEQEYASPRRIVLTDNYRSSQPILDAATRLIDYNPDRLAVQDGFDKRLVARKVKDKAEPQLLKFATVTDEAEAVAKRFTEHHRQGIPWHEMAVLIRNKSLADYFTRAFQAAGIPSLASGSGRLYEQPEVKLCVNFLRAVADPHDSPSLHYLATSPVYDLPQDAVFTAARQMKRYHKPLFEVLKWQTTPPKQGTLGGNAVRDKINRLLDDIRSYAKQARNRPVDEVLFSWLAEAGYAARLKEAEQAQEVENLGRLFARLRQYVGTAADPTLAGWARHYEDIVALSDEAVAMESDAEWDAVRILTIHKAKGLEFEAVAVAGMVQGKFPGNRQSDGLSPVQLLRDEGSDPTQLHRREERRLGYVALTRARRFLYLTASTDYHGKKAWRLSPFVSEALGKDVATAMPERPTDPWAALGQSAPVVAVVSPTPKDQVLRLSFTRLSDYWTCPLKYYWKYVAGFPEERSLAPEYGSLVHRVIERINRTKLEGGAPKLSESLAWFEQGVSTLPVERPGHDQVILERGKATIKRFFAEEQKRPAPMAVEKNFKMALPGCVVIGRLDRLDRHQGKVTIVDYKTSESVDTQAKADTKLKKAGDMAEQLRLYALAYTEEHGEPPERIVFNFVETGVSAAVTPTNKQIQDLRQRIIDTADEIKEGKFVPNTSGHSCSPFADCPGDQPKHRTRT